MSGLYVTTTWKCKPELVLHILSPLSPQMLRERLKLFIINWEQKKSSLVESISDVPAEVALWEPPEEND